MGSPDSVSATMLLNSLIPSVPHASFKQSQPWASRFERAEGEGGEEAGGTSMQDYRDRGEQCETEYVNECAANKTNNKREKRGVLQAVLLTSAIASQNQGTTTEASAEVRCYHSPQPPV